MKSFLNSYLPDSLYALYADELWLLESQGSTDTDAISFWRPDPPPGYANYELRFFQDMISVKLLVVIF